MQFGQAALINQFAHLHLAFRQVGVAFIHNAAKRLDAGQGSGKHTRHGIHLPFHAQIIDNVVENYQAKHIAQKTGGLGCAFRCRHALLIVRYSEIRRKDAAIAFGHGGHVKLLVFGPAHP